MSLITAGQLRAARGLVGWSQQDLATVAKVGRATIADFEVGKRAPYARTLADLQRALESAGVEFTNGGEPGVKMKRSGAPAPALEAPTALIAADLPGGGDDQLQIRLRARRLGVKDSPEATISPEQVIAARELLGWSQGELAGKVGVSETAISLFEREKRRLLVLDASKLRSAFESAGVEFAHGGKPGARLKPDAKSKPEPVTIALDKFLSQLDAYEQRRLRPKGVLVNNRGGVKFGFALLYTGRDAASLMLEGKELGRVRWTNGTVEFYPPLEHTNPAHAFEEDLAHWASGAYARSISTG
jgi:transcriptional regulator with XRE-family HTH domain